MRPTSSRVAALMAMLVLGAGIGACGTRQDVKIGNPGQDPQVQQAPVGKNPATQKDMKTKVGD